METFTPTARESIQIGHLFLNLLFYHRILEDSRLGEHSPFTSHFKFWGIPIPKEYSNLNAELNVKDLIKFLNAIALSPLPNNFNPTHEIKQMLYEDSTQFGWLFHISNSFRFFEFSRTKAFNHLRDLDYPVSRNRKISSIMNSVIPTFYRYQPTNSKLVLELTDDNYKVLWHSIYSNYAEFARLALRTNFGWHKDL